MPWLFRVPLLQRWDERRRRRIKSSSKCPLNLANYSIFFISFDSIPGIFDIVVHGPTARVDIRLNERHIFFFLIIGFRFYFCPNLNFVKSKSMFVINAMLRCSQNRDRHKKKPTFSLSLVESICQTSWKIHTKLETCHLPASHTHQVTLSFIHGNCAESFNIFLYDNRHPGMPPPHLYYVVYACFSNTKKKNNNKNKNKLNRQ